MRRGVVTRLRGLRRWVAQAVALALLLPALIGLLPQLEQVAQVTKTAQALSPDIPLMDMIETADYPASADWQAALDFGLRAFDMLPRSKISISPEQVSVTAIATSASEKRAT